MPDKALTPAEIDLNRKSVAGLRTWLKRSEYNQRLLAEALDVSEATVSKWLSGKQSMTTAQFCQIAGILGAEPEELMAGPEQRARSARYARLAKLAGQMTDEQLRALEGVAAQLAGPSKRD